MRALTVFFGMGLFASGLLTATGCGQDDSLDLSDVPIASESEDQKSDVITPGGRIFTWVRPGSPSIRCIRPPCPIAALDDVNLQKSELTYGYDWRALKLSANDQASLEAGASTMLLYGKYATAKKSGESVQIYQVTRANSRVSEQSQDAPDADRYYTVRATDPSCSQPPCGYAALLMNRLVSEQWTGLDLSRLGLPQNALRTLIGELQKGSAYVSIQSTSAMPVVATEAFRSYNATPLPNN